MHTNTYEPLVMGGSCELVNMEGFYRYLYIITITVVTHI